MLGICIGAIALSLGFSAIAKIKALKREVRSFEGTD